MTTSEAPARIAVTGLAVMGSNLARNLARHGFRVAVHNRSSSRTEALISEHGHEGDFVPAETLEELVASLRTPRQIIIMVKAGAPTDAVIDELAPLLEPGDMVIDGGNAHYADTRRREAALKEAGLHFVGAGISGGEEGALNGPSIMPGGSAESYRHLGPVLESIAAQVDGVPCCVHVGPDGAGHFVKMVHNGIEYADMQLIAEAYDLLRRVGGLAPAEIAEVFRGWNTGDLESYLVEITAEVLGHVDAGSGAALVDVIADEAEQKGTGRWTVQEALELGVPVTGIAEAVFARSLSGRVGQREAVRRAFGAGEPAVSDQDVEQLVDDVRQALYASKVVAYAQGFDQMRAAGAEYGWDLDLGAMATIWRGGCIIRARFLDRIREAYDKEPALASLLVDDYFRDAVANAEAAWRRVVVKAVSAGVPAPGFVSALAYYDGLRSERLPASLVQVLRDFFGAHTYRRTDREGSFHTLWSGDRSQVDA
ncbi:NADP-dependent phosphogluconate dehydrogenase [Saccharothrix longispora]|uniref:NADP-dependent phosphogluconate dehydrogenase n=1 Tax=Saccharothrix longispora TaxID=33920 RepID=UPI0028FD383C|nr:NADP-dependent phosphogluconate dehydrogenase [Saccharothrix longispora]MBY8847437.1 NADP-dependent phosphogluconate dehydrogenase [Saccharothrix sp. MB29]MDU0290094.1 NADP-dependent phosphogluconate dehydrogenase [Saccharothrix longispora]